MNHHTERVIHTMASVTPVVDQWLENKWLIGKSITHVIKHFKHITMQILFSTVHKLQ